MSTFETTTKTLLELATRAREVLEIRKVETAHALAEIDQIPTFAGPTDRERTVAKAVVSYQNMLIAEQTHKRLNALAHPTLEPLESEHDQDTMKLWREKLEKAT
jgi:hypothetical protein